MKHIAFYIINKQTFQMRIKKYTNYIQKEIIQSCWFKHAVKEKLIKVKYLSTKCAIHTKSCNYYIHIQSGDIYYHKLHLIVFEYQFLENNNHLKLLHINLRNRTIFQVTQLLIKLQYDFINSHCCEDLKYYSRDEFIKIYKQHFSTYIDYSIITRVFKNKSIAMGKIKYDFSILLPKKSFVYSIKVQKIIYETKNQKLSDSSLAKIINEKYNLDLNRKNIHYIKNRYLISYKTDDFYLCSQKLFSDLYSLETSEVYSLKHNIKVLKKSFWMSLQILLVIYQSLILKGFYKA